ncbi:hypothetical protein [Anaeroselena agilis]|uniref:Uncharacterized protein n=1 Tax=Anaeroselena agilis TaxID=3063788 RepID=A0ABU3NZT5_9FIRM|nr:hypothetical protein [Selenomonadales bacterium 4137-cl]
MSELTVVPMKLKNYLWLRVGDMVFIDPDYAAIGRMGELEAAN